jgi:protein O-GlcNAc transferase
MATIREALALALDHHLAGRVVEADTLYGRILEVDPENAAALHLHGVLCAQTGRLTDAVALLRLAVRHGPAAPDHHVNLANALRALGRTAEAIDAYQGALALAPQRVDAGFGLAACLDAVGRREESAVAYGALLAHAPTHAEGWNNLGLVLRALGRAPEAVKPLTEAVRLTPLDARTQTNLAMTLDRAGDAEGAMAGYARALTLDPAFASVLTGLARCRLRVGEAAAAERLKSWSLRLRPDSPDVHAALARLRADRPALADAHLRRLLALTPADAEAWNARGLFARRVGRARDALPAFRRAVILRPDLGGGRINLALTQRDLGQPERAIAEARVAAALTPDVSAVLNNLALVCESLDQPSAAAALMARALRLTPMDADGWAYRGAMLRRAGRISSGLDACNRALALAPALVGGLANRAVIRQDLGNLDAAIADNRRAVVAAPDRADLHSNLLLSLQYSPRVTAAALLAEHRLWDDRHGRPHAPRAGWRHPNRPDPERRLRVGYVSADFGYHPIGYFLAPLLPAHDRAAVEIFCYNAKPREDGMTRRLIAGADHWRSIHGLDDAAAAGLIAADGIDILIDLAGHTANNRLPLFARKPAPVQATWAGYVGTTGLSAMDALIACPRQMPPGSDASVVERVIRLPDDYVCVLPREDAPAVGPPPCDGAGHVTFGCFNNRTKLSEPTLALWVRLLNRLPTARLLLKTHQFDDAGVRTKLLAAIVGLGGDPTRVELSGTARHADLPGWYNRIDVALDPFPYSGGLTTLEALWMGVPVVTLGGGDRFCARHSVAHLTAAGLSELIAADADAYLDIAAGLAQDRAALAALRAGLRDRMAASPLCDGPRFARHLEESYRALWRGWIQSTHS